MTIKDLLFEIAKKLQEAKIENYEAETYSLLSFVCHLSPSEIISRPEKNIKPGQIKKIRKMLKLRVIGWPLPYLIGQKSFYNLDFYVNKNTLIPRPESELIVEAVLEKVKNEKNKEINIIDIGTGSACLIISLADILQNKNNIGFYGIDISSPALKIARKNAKKHNLNKVIKFYQGSLLKPLIKKISKKPATYHILANLPYLIKEEIKKSPSLKMEPKRALDGGKDGLELYQKLFEQIAQIKQEQTFIIYAEINPWQKNKLIEITKKAFSKCQVEINTLLDLRGEDRIVVIKI